jgi:hypothetical protein
VAEGWIGVDLDGTLAQYDGWVNEMHIGGPIQPMVARVKAWLDAGHDVRIFTARVNDSLPLVTISVVESSGPMAGIKEVWIRQDQHIRSTIELWCQLHIGRTLPITNTKDYGMIELYDDRAVQVEANTGRLIGQSTRGL